MKPTATESEKQFFNQYVADKGEFDPFLPAGWQALARCFEALAQPAEGLNLLDVGCGTGQSLQIYSRYAKTYTGIDLSDKAIEIAQKRFAERRFLVADACKLPFEPDSFDAVAFSSVLHHIDDYGAALKEAYRVIKPGGLVFAYDPNVWHPAMALFRHPRSPLYRSAGVSPNERPLLPSALRKAFADASFQSIRTRCLCGIPYRGVAPKLLNKLIGVYNVADAIMEATRISRLIGTFAATAGRKAQTGKI